VPLEWISTYVQQAPLLDGKEEPLWQEAVPLQVPVREALGGGAPIEVILRALHTDDSFYVLVQWPDATASEMRDPHIWNAASNSYERPTLADDQFALQFPLAGEFNINMLSTDVSFTTDVWHWKAGRSNLGGWVDDKRHIISQTPVDGALAYQLGGRAAVYVARPMDAGAQSYAAIQAPEAHTADIVASYTAQQPDGSQADVRGKGLHDGKSWTLEMGRKFNTGFLDDAALIPSQEIESAIAVLNDELYWNHSVSQKLLLKLRKP
jgi:Ethylbenzene dehydrogenase